MKSALSKREVVADIAGRLKQLKPREREIAETLSTGLSELDNFAGGVPRGCITEIAGPQSSGRTSFMLSTLSEATNNDESCALVDTNNSLDIISASQSGIDLEKLLWIRCSGNVEHAFKSVDILLQGGGFGLIALDLGDVPVSYTSRIISSWWYRFRHTIEDTPTALIVIVQKSCARSAASMLLELNQAHSNWTSTSDILNQKPPQTHAISNLLCSTRLYAQRLKPMSLSAQGAGFATRASYSDR